MSKPSKPAAPARKTKTVAVIPTSPPPRGTVSDTNTKQMAAAFWTPRHMRRAR